MPAWAFFKGTKGNIPEQELQGGKKSCILQENNCDTLRASETPFCLDFSGEIH